MNHRFLRPLALLLVAFPFNFFSARAIALDEVKMGPITYTSANEQHIQRWITIEDLGSNRSLFLVVDQFPASETTSAEVTRLPQITAHREIVETKNLEKIAQLKSFYASLSDLPKGPSVVHIARQDVIHPSSDLTKTTDATALRPMILQPLLGRPLWVPIRNSWTRNDEDDYSKWVESSVDVNFVRRSSTKVDCADFAMLLRWVYARDHKLPMASTLSGSGQLFGHFSSNLQWDQLKEDADWRKDQRFQAALAYVLDNTYTHSLWGDLYPTTIDSAHVRPGTVFLFLRQNDGHTQTIKSIGANPDVCGDGQCIVTYWGNEPADQDVFISALIEPDVFGGIGNKKSGFMMWRWPRLINQNWELTPANQMADFSTVQYHAPIPSKIGDESYHDDYWTWLDGQIGLPPLTPLDHLKSNLSDFQRHIYRRLMLTSLGQVYCVMQSCPVGSPAEGGYSTPDGDSEMRKLSDNIVKFLSKIDPADAQLQELIKKNSVPLIFGQPASHNIWNLAINANNVLGTFSPKADGTFPERWGLQESVGHPDLEFPMNATVLQILLRDRDMMVFQASATCFPNGVTKPACNPQSSVVADLNTKTLDNAISKLAPQLLKMESGVSSSVTGAVQAHFKDVIIMSDVGSDDTAYDEIFGGGASRMNRWTSNPTDSTASRWGR